MFRSFIYLDKDKLYSYKRLIDGGRIQPTSISQKKTKAATAGVSKTALSYSTEENITTEYDQDPFWDYDRFELRLSEYEGEDFFDFVINCDNYDLTTIPQMKIIKINGNMQIPEAFDIYSLVESFKPFLIGQIETKTSGEKNILDSLLGGAKADIPIIVEYDNCTVFGKLNTNYLMEDHTALEDYEEQEITILCKVVGLAKQERVTIFHPLKDFIKLNRAIRRTGNFDRNNDFSPIIINGPVLKVEIIAVYK